MRKNGHDKRLQESWQSLLRRPQFNTPRIQVRSNRPNPSLAPAKFQSPLTPKYQPVNQSWALDLSQRLLVSSPSYSILFQHPALNEKLGQSRIASVLFTSQHGAYALVNTPTRIQCACLVIHCSACAASVCLHCSSHQGRSEREQVDRPPHRTSPSNNIATCANMTLYISRE